MDKPVYLDWAATAPLCKEAANAMAPYLQAGIDGLVAGNGNANSLYEVGRTAFRALEQAREDIARSIKARPDEMTFTSGATEADNAALFGIVDAAIMNAFPKSWFHPLNTMPSLKRQKRWGIGALR